MQPFRTLALRNVCDGGDPPQLLDAAGSKQSLGHESCEIPLPEQSEKSRFKNKQSN